MDRQKTNTAAIKSRSARSATQATDRPKVDVLYQKMGDKWFVFSVVNEELYVGSLTDSDLKASGRQTGNS